MSAAPWNVVDWYTTVALFPGVGLIGADDITVQVHASSPNDEDAVDHNPHVSVTVGLDTTDLAPSTARKLADALNRAADIAEGLRVQ